jgi:hypothetical protein
LRGDAPTSAGDTGTNNGRWLFSRGDHSTRTMSEFRDGTSNTVMFSEAVIGAYDVTLTNIRGGTFHPGINSEAGGNAFLEVCRAGRGAGGELNGAPGTIPGPGPTRIGTRWADGYTAYVLFHTILPPNHVTCASAQGSIPAERSIVTVSSNHPGGVNVALGDASVRFVTDSVNYITPGRENLWTGPNSPPQTFTGPSPFGIWGAYGSLNGSESVGSL